MGGALSSLGIGQAKYDAVIFADQEGPHGKPTEFKPSEHRKYDAKVRVQPVQRRSQRNAAAVQRDVFEPHAASRLGSACYTTFS